MTLLLAATHSLPRNIWTIWPGKPSRYPSLYTYVKVLDRRTGDPRFSADADHIIPKSVWNILMPATLRGQPGDKFPCYSGVLSNLFWRDKKFNRNDDDLAI